MDAMKDEMGSMRINQVWLFGGFTCWMQGHW